MKPVQLLPPKQTAAQTRSADAQGAGLVLVAGVALLGVVGYFEWSMVSDVKSRTAQSNVAAQTAQTQYASLQRQITEAGQKDDFTTLAGNAQQQVITSLAQRKPFAKLAAELANVVPKGAWLTNVNADTTNASSTSDVTIEGHAPDSLTVSELVTRLDATQSLSDASMTSIAPETDSKGRPYRKFTITAKLVAQSSTSLTGLVGSGSTGGAPSGIALDPTPDYGKAAAKAAAPAKPKVAPKPLSAMEKVARDANRAGGGA